MRTVRPSLLLVLLLLLGVVGLAFGQQAPAWQWASSPGGGFGRATAVDAVGDAYVIGVFSGTATFGITTLTSAGGDDVFVAKLTSNGTYQWAVRAGGPSNDGGSDIAVDGNGNVVVAGYFVANATFGATTLTSAGGEDAFVAQLSPTGTWQWISSAGGPGNEGANAVAVDGSGQVAVTGEFTSGAVFGATTLSSGGSTDLFVAILSPTGVWQWVNSAVGTNPNRVTGTRGC